MGYWNYQVMKTKDGLYAIHEYFPMEDGPGWTENPTTLYAETVDDLKEQLGMMLRDIDRHGVRDYKNGEIVE